jgi:hypothetical protein
MPYGIKTLKNCQNIFTGQLLSLRFVFVGVFSARFMGFPGS